MPFNTIGIGQIPNGNTVRWSPVFSATGLTFNGSNSTYPTYDSYYAKNGNVVSFWIRVNLTTVTNFGTGQYKVELPFMPKNGTMNHFPAWCWIDPSINPDFGEHIVLQADHLSNTKILDLHWLGLSTPNPKPVQEHIFMQNHPVVLNIHSNIYVNGTYISEE